MMLRPMQLSVSLGLIKKGKTGSNRMLRPRHKCKSETNKEKEDRMQAAKLGIVCNDTWKLHFVFSVVLSPSSSAICIDTQLVHPDSYNIIYAHAMGCNARGMCSVESSGYYMY